MSRLKTSELCCQQVRMVKSAGSALIISMVLLAVMTLTSIISMQGTVLEEKMAGNTRDRQLAFEAAEAAIRSGEEYILTNAFDYTKFTDTCTKGLCTRREDDVTYVQSAAPGNTGWVDPRWDLDGSLNVWADNSGRYREYSVKFAETANRPRYIIEFAGYRPVDPTVATLTTPPQWYPGTPVAGTTGWQSEWAELYRITALGFGGTPDAKVMVQTMYSKSF